MIFVLGFVWVVASIVERDCRDFGIALVVAFMSFIGYHVPSSAWVWVPNRWRDDAEVSEHFARTDSLRIQRALERLDNRASESQRARGKQRLRRRNYAVLGIFATTALALAGGVAVAAFGHNRGHRAHHLHSDPGLAQQLVGYTITILGILVILLGLRRLLTVPFETLHWGSWNSPLLALRPGQRHSLAKQVRGQEPAIDETLPIALHLAEMSIRQRQFIRFWVGLALFGIGVAIVSTNPWQWLLDISVTAVMCLAVVVTIREARRAEDFIARHGPHVSEHPLPD